MTTRTCFHVWLIRAPIAFMTQNSPGYRITRVLSPPFLQSHRGIRGKPLQLIVPSCSQFATQFNPLNHSFTPRKTSKYRCSRGVHVYPPTFFLHVVVTYKGPYSVAPQRQAERFNTHIYPFVQHQEPTIENFCTSSAISPQSRPTYYDIKDSEIKL